MGRTAVRTNLFGKLGGVLRLPLDGGKVAWAPHLVFPNLLPGETVGRRLTLGHRAPIMAKPYNTSALPVMNVQGNPMMADSGI